MKRRTATIHVRAEETVRAFDPFASRERYAAYLLRLRGFYAALEPRLAPFVDATERRKLPHIDADLRVLGIDPALAARASFVPVVTSRAAALGVSYVLEGKTLGARFLLEEAHAKLGDIGATRFLAGYGTRTGPMWKAFRAELESFVAREGRRATVLAAARATFASFVRAVATSTAAAAAGTDSASCSASATAMRSAP